MNTLHTTSPAACSGPTCPTHRRRHLHTFRLVRCADGSTEERDLHPYRHFRLPPVLSSVAAAATLVFGAEVVRFRGFQTGTTFYYLQVPIPDLRSSLSTIPSDSCPSISCDSTTLSPPSNSVSHAEARPSLACRLHHPRHLTTSSNPTNDIIAISLPSAAS